MGLRHLEQKLLSKCVVVTETQGVEEKLRFSDMRGGSCLMHTRAGGIWVCSVCVSKKLTIPVYFHISLTSPVLIESVNLSFPWSGGFRNVIKVDCLARYFVTYNSYLDSARCAASWEMPAPLLRVTQPSSAIAPTTSRTGTMGRAQALLRAAMTSCEVPHRLSIQAVLRRSHCVHQCLQALKEDDRGRGSKRCQTN